MLRFQNVEFLEHNLHCDLHRDERADTLYAQIHELEER